MTNEVCMTMLLGLRNVINSFLKESALQNSHKYASY